VYYTLLTLSPHSFVAISLFTSPLFFFILTTTSSFSFFFFFNDTATTEISTLSLHDALPISDLVVPLLHRLLRDHVGRDVPRDPRSEEHTSELQSLTNLVCRLLLEKKKIRTNQRHILT